MPLPVENLTQSSDMGEIRAAISSTISKLMDEGKPQDQATAQALEMARRASGKEV